MRSIGTAEYSNRDARASKSGFRQALSACHAVGGRLSAVSIPSAIGTMDTQAKLAALQAQVCSLQAGEVPLRYPFAERIKQPPGQARLCSHQLFTQQLLQRRL